MNVTPEPSGRRSAAAATAGAIGGLALFCDLSLRAFGPLDRSYFLVATVMALCLLGVPTAFWLRGAITTGWRRGLAVSGTALVVLGVAAWITAFVVLFTDPRAAFSQRLTPAGSVLMALGMLLVGVAVLASRRLPPLWGLAPLAVGVYFPAQLVVQLAFFLNGEDADPGPDGALLGIWGLLWAWAAIATVAGRARADRDRPEPPSRRLEQRGAPGLRHHTTPEEIHHEHPHRARNSAGREHDVRHRRHEDRHQVHPPDGRGRARRPGGRLHRGRRQP